MIVGFSELQDRPMGELRAVRGSGRKSRPRCFDARRFSFSVSEPNWLSPDSSGPPSRPAEGGLRDSNALLQSHE